MKKHYADYKPTEGHLMEFRQNIHTLDVSTYTHTKEGQINTSLTSEVNKRIKSKSSVS